MSINHDTLPPNITVKNVYTFSKLAIFLQMANAKSNTINHVFPPLGASNTFPDARVEREDNGQRDGGLGIPYPWQRRQRKEKQLHFCCPM